MRKTKDGKTTVCVREVPKPRRSVFSAVRHAAASLRDRVIYRVSSESTRRKMDADSLDRANHKLQQNNQDLRQELGMKDPGAVTRAERLDSFGKPVVLTPAEKNKELQATNFVLRQLVQAGAQMKEVIDIAANYSVTRGHELPERVQAIFQVLEVLNAERPARSDPQIADLYLERMQAYVSSRTSSPNGEQPTLTRAELASICSSVAKKDIRTGLSTGATRVLDNLGFCARAEGLRRDAANGLGRIKEVQLQAIRQDADKLLNDVHQQALNMKSTDAIPGTKFTLNTLTTLRDDAIDWLTVSKARGFLAMTARVDIDKLTGQPLADVQAAIALCKKRPKMFTAQQITTLDQYSAQLNSKQKATATTAPLRAVDNVKAAKQPGALQGAMVAKPKAVEQPGPATTAQVTTGKVDRATLLKAEQKKVQDAFQRLLSEAMGYMWDASPGFDDEIDDFNQAASACLIKAAQVFQAAMMDRRLKLTDYEQSRWIRETVGSMNPKVLRGIQARLNDENNALIDQLLSCIEPMKGVPVGTQEFVAHWAHEVVNASAENA